jgi:hypothetical protein
MNICWQRRRRRIGRRRLVPALDARSGHPVLPHRDFAGATLPALALGYGRSLIGTLQERVGDSR